MRLRDSPGKIRRFNRSILTQIARERMKNSLTAICLDAHDFWRFVQATVDEVGGTMLKWQKNL